MILCAGFAASPVGALPARIIRSIPASLFRPWLPNWLIRYFLVGPEAPATLVRQVKQTVSSVAPQVLHQRLYLILTHSATRAMAEVAVPTLYIQASHDHLVPPSAFKTIALAQPKVLHQLVNGPHLLAQANPSEVAAAVVNFLDTLS